MFLKRLLVLIFSISISYASVFAEEQGQVVLSSSQKAVRTSSDVLLVAMPVATLAGVIITQDWTGLKQAAFSAAATVGVSYLLKYTINKQRPDLSDNHSFPSAHTSIMFANAAFIQRRYGWKIGLPAYTLAAYVGWARTYSKRHDWWDVVAGAAIGAGCSYIFTRPFSKKHELSILPISNGQSFGLAASMKF